MARIMVLAAAMACDCSDACGTGALALRHAESVCSLVGRLALGHLVVSNGCAGRRSAAVSACQLSICKKRS